jgi:hypothetical protein
MIGAVAMSGVQLQSDLAPDECMRHDSVVS